MTSLVPAPYTTDISVINTGIIRNLLKTTYYLRIPKDLKRDDRIGRTIAIKSCVDVELDYRDWKLVEPLLINLDFRNILRIIRYPERSSSTVASSIVVVTSYHQLPTPPLATGTIVFAQYGDYQGIFYYDSARNEWLSENLITYTWSSATASTIKELTLVSNSDGTHKDNDISIVKPMTVVGMSGSQAEPLVAGSQTIFRLDKIDKSTGVVTENICSVALSIAGERGVQDLNLNTAIDTNFMLSSVRVSPNLDKIVRPAVTVWLRERLTP